MAEHWIAVSDEEKELIRLLRQLPASVLKERIRESKLHIRVLEIRKMQLDEYTAAKSGSEKTRVIEKQWRERRRVLSEYESGSGKISHEETELKQFAADNERGIIYNGKHYTLYQAGQEQATMENAIRNLRRQILADEETKSPDLQKHQIRLRVLQSEYTRFCKAAKLPTRNERLQVAGFGRSQASKAVWTYRKDAQGRKLQKLNYADDVTPEQRSSIEKELSVLPQAQREAAEQQIHSLRLEGNNSGSHYDPKTKEIVLSTTRNPGDIIHEYGHALERALKLEKDSAFIALREKGIDLADTSKIVYDETTFTEPIWRVRSDKFVSAYQGRRYESAGIYDGRTINLTSMKEYFAEGYREFYVNPENLRLHDPDLYDYIRRLLYDQE